MARPQNRKTDRNALKLIVGAAAGAPGVAAGSAEVAKPLKAYKPLKARQPLKALYESKAKFKPPPELAQVGGVEFQLAALDSSKYIQLAQYELPYEIGGSST